MITIWQDIRYGLRMLRKSPGFTAIALITLAIGIGANTIMFSIADVLVLLRAKKVKNPEQLAYCAIQSIDDSSFRYSEYLTLRDSGLAFSDVMAQMTFPWRETLVRGRLARHVWAAYVSTNYFSVLGITPLHGRGFLPEEERQGSAPVVVLSYRCWHQLGSDPKLVGEFLNIDGIACRVVGVAPEGFTGVTLDGSDLLLPLGSFRTVNKFARSRPDWKPWLHVVGRIKPMLTMSIAQAQIQTLFPDFKPECLQGKSLSNPSFNLRPPGRDQIPGEHEGDRQIHKLFSLVLISASALILVIACLNLANILQVPVKISLKGSVGAVAGQGFGYLLV